MKIDVDNLTHEEISDLQQVQWDSTEFEGVDDGWARAMIELCENMKAMPTEAYRNYLRTCEENWRGLDGDSADQST